MISYAVVGSNQLDKALPFYDELLGQVGIAKLFDHPNGGALYGKQGKTSFAVLAPFDGKPATVGNGTMAGFELESRDQVKAFHAKALELGGTNEGDPGLRGPEEYGFFYCYFRDLDGNKLCAFKIG
jgi:catechol 2,3-dioxygenase-like lactoylglutathione lyase family enzyme